MPRRRAVEALRIPAGLPGAGRFTSADRLTQIALTGDDKAALLVAAELSRVADALARQAATAQRALDRAERRFDDDPRRFARQRARAEDVYLDISQRESDLARRADAILTAMLPAAPTLDAAVEPDEDVAEEWELGFAYQAGKGRGHDVDVNVRFRRRDRRKMGRREAEEVLSWFVQSAELGEPAFPAGYEGAAIRWSRPRSGSRRWTQSFDVLRHLESFALPMYSKSDLGPHTGVWTVDPLRLGSVKEW